MKRYLAAGLAWCAVTCAAAAQDDPGPVFGEIVEVQLVNVEVWVTDAKGYPVQGLKVDDFQVLEDGEPVSISHFSEVRPGPPGAVAAAAPTVVEGSSWTSAAPTRGAEPRHLVLYFDELHLRAGSRRRLVADLRRSLDYGQVPPEQILVVRQDEVMTVETAFGSSRAQLEATLDRLESPSAAGSRTEQEKRLAVEELQRLWVRLRDPLQGPGGMDPCEAFVRMAAREIERYAAQSRARISLTLDHLTSLASFLTGVPGVKTLVYLSDALETSPGADLLDFVQRLCPVSRQEATVIGMTAALAESFRRLTRHANANRVTIYAIQPEGLRSSSFAGPEQSFLEPRGLSALRAAVRIAEQDGLLYLAKETGGRAVFATNRLVDDLERIGREMSSYYSLAYEPPHGGDGLEHDIEVRIKGALRVRHRLGYRDKSPDQRMEERMEGALHLGLVSNPLRTRLGAGELRRTPAGEFRLPLHVMVPVDRVVFLTEDDGSRARLRVLIRAHDHRGVRVVSEERGFRVARPRVAATELLDLLFDLELGEGLYTIVVGLRDEVSRESSYVSTTVEIQDPERDSGG